MKVVISAIASPSSVSTAMLRGWKDSRSLVPEVVAERELPVGTRRNESPALAAPQDVGRRGSAVTVSRPRYQVGGGGIAIVTFAVSMATMAPTSARSQAWT